MSLISPWLGTSAAFLAQLYHAFYRLDEHFSHELPLKSDFLKSQNLIRRHWPTLRDWSYKFRLAEMFLQGGDCHMSARNSNQIQLKHSQSSLQDLHPRSILQDCLQQRWFLHPDACCFVSLDVNDDALTWWCLADGTQGETMPQSSGLGYSESCSS